jgi:tRNA pseudouridine38-40 synthase
MSNIKLIIEYDGTGFVGWQYQENGRSVQHEIEKALRQVLQEDIRVSGAGRTDAGVHARGQVASFRTTTAIDARSLLKSLNGVLPSDIAILSAEEVNDDFHARYSAKFRRYKYYISTRPTALMRLYSWSLVYPLSLDLMNNCARLIAGEHDFSSFCKSEAETKHHRCIVAGAQWTKRESMLEFDILSNRFLHGMVRALVGTMVDVGRGYCQLEDFKAILEAKDRRSAGMSAPPHGLFLDEVLY